MEGEIRFNQRKKTPLGNHEAVIARVVFLSTSISKCLLSKMHTCVSFAGWCSFTNLLEDPIFSPPGGVSQKIQMCLARCFAPTEVVFPATMNRRILCSMRIHHDPKENSRKTVKCEVQ